MFVGYNAKGVFSLKITKNHAKTLKIIFCWGQIGDGKKLKKPIYGK